MESIPPKKLRLEWLDALRGFTMIMVVANHVAGIGFGEKWKHSSAIPSLQYIGRRMLDIYLVHFLFMPELPGVGAFLKSYPHNFVVDVVLSVVLGLVIIGFSIITSNILRISPFLKKWLFGRS